MSSVVCLGWIWIGACCLCLVVSGDWTAGLVSGDAGVEVEWGWLPGFTLLLVVKKRSKDLTSNRPKND